MKIFRDTVKEIPLEHKTASAVWRLRMTWRIKALSCAAFLSGSGAFAQSPSGTQTWLGVRVDGARVNDKTTAVDEIDKSGSLVDGSLVADMVSPNFGLFGLQLGIQQIDVKGTNAAKGIAQKVHIVDPYVAGRYLFRINEVQLGLDLRDQFGKGANYGVHDTNTWRNEISVGPEVGYRHEMGAWAIEGSVAYLFDVNNKSRRISSLIAGVALTHQFGVPASETAPPVAATPSPPPAPRAAPSSPEIAAPTPVPPPQGPAPRAITLDSKLLNFAPGSGHIDAKGQARLKRLADLLKKQADNWSLVKIAGHTDATGQKEKNLKLSEARAESVKAELVKGGVAKAKIQAKGFGDSMLLPGVSPKDGANRRVEFEFEGTKDKGKLYDGIQQALQEVK